MAIPNIQDGVIDLKSVTSDVKKEVGAKSTSVSDSTDAKAANSAASLAALESQYQSSSGGRLVNFQYLTGDDDKSRRAKFRLIGNTEKLAKDIAGNALSLNFSNKDAILAALGNDAGFSNFILTSITENQQEKEQLLETINDHFVVTYSGKSPQLVHLNGLLPFDANTKSTSWFADFVNSYKFIFRASVLAKYKLQLQVILPDFYTYTCYPTSFSASIQSVQDGLIAFQMVALVVEETISKATNVSSNATKVTTAVDQETENKKVTEKQKNDSSTKNDPQSVGKASNNQNFIQKAINTVNEAMSGKTGNDIAKAINTVNKTFAVVGLLKNYGLNRIIK